MKYDTRSKNCYCVQCGGWAAPRGHACKKQLYLAVIAKAPVVGLLHLVSKDVGCVQGKRSQSFQRCL